ncbi:MAG TPA: hypothetical protein VGN64_09285 [Dyadobacter sp.]|nr:hypothetical protein [Dyadobacter sp.]
MGFGFDLFFIFILIPLTAIGLIAWLSTRNITFGETIMLIWLGVFGIVILAGTIQWLTAKTELRKEDY